jgi:hypothetical protein
MPLDLGNMAAQGVSIFVKCMETVSFPPQFTDEQTAE